MQSIFSGLLKAVLITCPLFAFAQDFNIDYGEYPVGFRFESTINYAQMPCDELDSDEGGKPVYFGVWYPSKKAKGASMTLKDYVDMKGLDQTSTVEKIRKFARESWFDYTMEEYLDSSYTAKQRDFESTLSLNCRANFEAESLDKQFPAIIYHHGAGGTYDDNALTCEFIASHGFVVVSSPLLQCNSFGAFETSDYYASPTDIDAILPLVNAMPNVQHGNLALMGHSRGSQIGYSMTSHAYAPYKCFVSLDPTWDGKSFEKLFTDWRKPSFLRLIEENIDNYSTPILHMATFRENSGISEDSAKVRNANFDMQLPVTDKLMHAERSIITTHPDFGHEAFISQAGYDYWRMRPSLSDSADLAYVDMMIYQYEFTCNTLLQYFNLYLKPNESGMNAWQDYLTNLDWEKDLAKGKFISANPKSISKQEWQYYVENNGVDSLTMKLKVEVAHNGYHRFSHEYMAQYYFNKNNALSKDIASHYMVYKPDSWLGYYLSGTYEMNMGNKDAGLKYYEDALAHNPPDDMVDFLKNGYYYEW